MWKTTTWNAFDIVKTNNFNYWEMIFWKGLYRSSLKDSIKFKM
jgi:hypothetical protein